MFGFFNIIFYLLAVCSHDKRQTKDHFRNAPERIDRSLLQLNFDCIIVRNSSGGRKIVWTIVGLFHMARDSNICTTNKLKLKKTVRFHHFLFIIFYGCCLVFWLWWVSGQPFESAGDFSWDWWWCWQMGTLWLVTIFISNVLDVEFLSIFFGPAELACGYDGFLFWSQVLQLTGSLSVDTVRGFVLVVV